MKRLNFAQPRNVSNIMMAVLNVIVLFALMLSIPIALCGVSRVLDGNLCPNGAEDHARCQSECTELDYDSGECVDKSEFDPLLQHTFQCVCRGAFIEYS